MKRRTWMAVIVALVLAVPTIVIVERLHMGQALRPNTDTSDIVFVSEDSSGFEIFHDNKRNITCYRRAASLSCVKD